MTKKKPSYWFKMENAGYIDEYESRERPPPPKGIPSAKKDVSSSEQTTQN